jgi:peroxiredoxin
MPVVRKLDRDGTRTPHQVLQSVVQELSTACSIALSFPECGKTNRGNTMKWVRLIAAVCVCVPALCHAVAVKEMAPDFVLKSIDGKNLRLNEYRGQVVLINFWASWCGRYRDAGFTVLGVNVEGKEGPAKEVASKAGVSFPVLVDDGQKVSGMYKLESMPSSVIVDRDGVIRYIHAGYKPGDEAKYIEVVKELISE